jgi:hypothetical protein
MSSVNIMPTDLVKIFFFIVVPPFSIGFDFYIYYLFLGERYMGWVKLAEANWGATGFIL